MKLLTLILSTSLLLFLYTSCFAQQYNRRANYTPNNLLGSGWFISPYKNEIGTLHITFHPNSTSKKMGKILRDSLSTLDNLHTLIIEFSMGNFWENTPHTIDFISSQTNIKNLEIRTHNKRINVPIIYWEWISKNKTIENLSLIMENIYISPKLANMTQLKKLEVHSSVLPLKHNQIYGSIDVMPKSDHPLYDSHYEKLEHYIYYKENNTLFTTPHEYKVPQNSNLEALGLLLNLEYLGLHFPLSIKIEIYTHSINEKYEHHLISNRSYRIYPITFPSSLSNLAKLETLDLSQSLLCEIPDWVADLKQLKRLRIKNSLLDSLPNFIGDLHNLEELYLDANTINKLPESIGKLSNLEILRCSNMKNLKKIPRAMSKLRKLKKLNLSGAPLKELPSFITDLENLVVLNCSNTHLQKLPKKLDKLYKLEMLHLEGNQLKALPSSIGNLQKLKLLDLNYNQIQSLPNNIGKLDQLQQLSLHNNQLKSLPNSTGNLSQLKLLKLGHNQVQSLPNSIGKLNQLEQLLIGESKLKSLPNSMGELSNLKHLYIAKGQIKKLPKSISQLPNLKHFTLMDNQLSDFTFTRNKNNFSKLISLNLSGNQLDKFPYITDYQKLEDLDLSANKITTIPGYIHKMKVLKQISLYDNEFTAEDKNRFEKEFSDKQIYFFPVD
ncbi:MAG: hypothetical protein MK212_07335 [Saprospiraceae bacterium]|nr:hypothetical protein [Saprospiraceae bacterium]